MAKLEGQVQAMAHDAVALKIELAATRSALTLILGGDSGASAQQFNQAVAVYSQEHADLYNLRVTVHRQQPTMARLIEMYREFNQQHNLKVTGRQFGLCEWLNDNPDGLSEEERAQLAREFYLQPMETQEDSSDETVDQVGAGDDH